MNIVKAAESRAMLGKLLETSTTSGGEYHSPCPKCGGKDRFVMWPKHPEYADRGGRYWCRRCGISGDGIQFMIDHCGMSFRDACVYLNVDPAKLKVRSRFTLPDLGGARTEYREMKPVSEEWSKKLDRFIASCRAALTDESLAFFASRGISKETVGKYKLGYNPKTEEIVWGTRNKENEVEGRAFEAARGLGGDNYPASQEMMYMPPGHVLPNIREGKIVGLSVRTNAKGFSRYYNAKDSATTIFHFGDSPTTDKPVMIVESALDALMITDKAGDLVEAVALGSASTKPDAYLHGLLESAPFIIIALDHDKAGEIASGYWLDAYRHARKGTIPEGKDPGEYFAKGGDIRTWVKALLPEQLWLSPEELKAWTETLKAGAAEKTEEPARAQSC